MVCPFKPISRSWVAISELEEPLGVIEFIGGAALGTFPTIAYQHFLTTLWEHGYTVIAGPYPLGFNHKAIAESLKDERDIIRATLNYSHKIPQIWVAHSLGCKYIALLEIQKDIIDQPSLLIAPNIGSTRNAIPLDWLASLLDNFNLGVRPDRETTLAWIEKAVSANELFHITSLLSFEQDCISGNRNGRQDCPKRFFPPSPPSTADVKWFDNLLQNRPDFFYSFHQIKGGHNKLAGWRRGQFVKELDNSDGQLIQPIPREVENSSLEIIKSLRDVAQTLLIDEN
ncbi:MAG: DUF1350 family protein [Cyanobacteria bacterium P01_G01_bin.67]